ncbi:hypothetical protein DCF40_03760 [Edwardsiella piscicida]|uniref:hypothetical protein n=1 Tax=Edwardsiella piscicida TaxID=1263550 RepID=UPI001CF56255|nr:hypothetical protein [Edwardsiella piscicida]UCQ58291.1 hypothetical protein DCF40_03760 [Edwardsiella piscicida]
MKHNKKILLTALMPFCFFLQNAAAHEGHSHTDGAPSVAERPKAGQDDNHCPCHPHEKQDDAMPLMEEIAK